jgi:hypothetical protein
MKRLALIVVLAACKHAPEAKPVESVEAPITLGKSIDVDTMRLERSAQAAPWRVAALVEAHLATVGAVQPGRAEGGDIVIVALLPTAGYSLSARVVPKPEAFCQVRLEVVHEAKPVAAAPWWAIDALERVHAGVSSLRAPALARLDAPGFARLRSEAAELARNAADPPIDRDAYIHAPRPITAGGPEHYYAPPTGPSHLLPNDPRYMR